MYQGDPKLFIEREIEVGLSEGIDIRPYIKEGMSGKEVRDLRLSLWAKSVTSSNPLAKAASHGSVD